MKLFVLPKNAKDDYFKSLAISSPERSHRLLGMILIGISVIVSQSVNFEIILFYFIYEFYFLFLSFFSIVNAYSYCSRVNVFKFLVKTFVININKIQKKKIIDLYKKHIIMLLSLSIPSLKINHIL